MSTASIDTSRTTERLSAFMSRITNAEPVDNIFVDLPLFNDFWAHKETIDGGRQQQIPVDTATNTTIAAFGGHDTIDTSPQDTARTAVFAYINYAGSVTISWEEMRETANADVRVFDLVKHKRNNAVKSMKDVINADFCAATPASGEINSLPFIVTTSGTVGGLASPSYWQAQETTSVGAFGTAGLTNMRTLFNDIKKQGQGGPDITYTTQTVFEAYEAEIDPDVTYTDSSKLSRGAIDLTWKGKPFKFDADITSGELYMINWNWLKLAVDTDGDMQFDEFIRPANQKAFTATFAFRGQLITSNRRALGRLTGIS